MYLLLLLFGGLLTAAGILLAAVGAPFGDHALDATIFTPGIVAVVGGLLLFGLGMALRVLQRIEQALALRQMPRVARPGEPTDPVVAAELTSEPARIPLPSKSAIRSQPAIPLASVPLTSVAENQVEAPAEKAAAAAKFESGRAAEDTELSLAPRSLSPFAPSSADPANADADKARLRRRNGAASARITPRFDLSPRSPNSAERPAGPALDALWPKGPRPLRAAGPAVAPAVAAEPKDEPVLAPPAPVQVQAEAPVPVSVLKSGVVDGMAYTLYSDGSIEAQLPQGTLRFGSITELRNHIEQSA